MWNKKELLKLYELRKKNKSWKTIALMLQKSEGSCKRKYGRTNWELFVKNSGSIFLEQKKWTKEELIALHSLRTKASLSYQDIASQLGRTSISCERKFQETDWSDFTSGLLEASLDQKEKHQKESKNLLINDLAAHMVNLSRHNVDKLDEMSKSFFIEKTNLLEKDLPIPFKDLKRHAQQLLSKMGFYYDSQIQLGKGIYIIVGDSHGKHTRRYMFNLLKTLNKFLKANKIIHIGHILDDDNDISYCWDDIKNLVILAKKEELQQLSDMQKYNIIRNEIFLGNLSVCNQDEISDYTNTSIGRIKKQIFPNTTVLNLHRHEMDSRTRMVDAEQSQLVSPGCLCEPYVVRTIKQINWDDSKIQVKLAYWDGFSKYRKMRHRYIFWEQGLLVVHVDENNNFDIIPCKIQKTSKGYTTSYFDKIITENEILDPKEKVFFNTDLHVPSHDENILSLQEQFCEDYKPDVVVNLGDLADNRALNHHEMEKNGWKINKSILDEYASAHYVLKQMRRWGKIYHLLLGNHERFVKDFFDKLPQFKDLLSFSFLCNIKSLNINLIDMKNILRLHKMKFIHGDLKMFGAKGSGRLEKASQVIGDNTILADAHYPAIRFGCYSVGLTGKLNQEYNEPSVTRWLHGFGYSNVFEDKCFISLVNIDKNRFSINNKKYVPKNTSKWQIPLYEAAIGYDYKEKNINT